MSDDNVTRCAHCGVDASTIDSITDHAETCEYRLANPTPVSEGLKITEDIVVKFNPETNDYKMVSEVIPELDVKLSNYDMVRIKSDLNALDLTV